MHDQHAHIDIDILESDDLVVVVVEGEVDLAAASDFTAGLARALASQAPVRSRLSFVPSPGL